MKKLLIFALLSIFLIFPTDIHAQSMMESQVQPTTEDHTAREEAEGKEIWEKLQAKEVTCDSLSDADFGPLGEYFMGQMMGDSHEAMNNKLIQMLGEDGEEQMHIAMGKRMSSCEPNAPMSQNMPVLSGVEGMSGGMMSMMMNMMKRGGNPMPALSGVEGMENGGWNNIMGGWGGFGWVAMLLFWGLLILAIIALLKWLFSGGRGQPNKTPLEILQERFAKGEIDKREYEEKAKILSKSR